MTGRRYMNKRKKTVYLAGPLFTHAELNYNRELKDMMKRRGFRFFFPRKMRKMQQMNVKNKTRSVFSKNAWKE